MDLNLRIKKLSTELKNIEDNDGFSCDEDDRAIINVGAENYDDIFSPYCFKGGDTLSMELVEYLWEKQSAIPLSYDISLKFNVKDANEEKRKEIQMAVKENYENDIHAVDQKLHRLTVLSIWFILLGIIFGTVYVITLPFILLGVSYVIDIMAWIFLWEGVRAIVWDRRTLRQDKIKALRLAAAKIEVKEFEPY